MQPGYPGSGQDPYNQQPPSDPFPPNYGQYPPQPDPYAQPQQPASGAPYQDPYAPPQEYSVQQPTSGQPYDPYQQPQSAPPVSYPPAYPAAPGYQAPGYQQPGYQQPAGYPGGAPGYPQAAQPAGKNTFAIVSLILGIAALVLQCCYGAGILLGGAAVVLGYLAQQKVKTENAGGRGMALAGLICGGIGAVLSLIWLILIIANIA
jgi:Domain of unknown function (DUF4190)